MASDPNFDSTEAQTFLPQDPGSGQESSCSKPSAIRHHLRSLGAPRQPSDLPAPQCLSLSFTPSVCQGRALLCASSLPASSISAQNASCLLPNLMKRLPPAKTQSIRIWGAFPENTQEPPLLLSFAFSGQLHVISSGPEADDFPDISSDGQEDPNARSHA